MSAVRKLPATSEDCRVVLTEEALAYLKQQGVRLEEAEGVTIPSKYAQGFALATGEVVVVENGWRADAPAFIFATEAGFAACCRADHFPVPPADVTWPEAHARNVRRFLTHPAVYADPLRTALGVAAPFRTLAACETAFAQVLPYIRRTSVPWKTREPVAYAFGLAAAQFCVAHWGLSCTVRKWYDLYNPYYRPHLKFAPAGGHAHVTDVFNTVIAICRSTSKPNFPTLMWWLTGVSPVKQATGMPTGE
ncbi:hypothetical protein [Hymenobacter canadensis]|uniref:Uncharacterized protein n=1 Tax=Hymenobacter canadensis TaxID=2999067 RepID=A0ABY7LU97_9BACT|nr:hypothetical protein [Hymenobacter canadensis]WBA43971.1 hypothetical protein O3303_20615 [Hymenobacter canadensis]